MEMIFQYMFSNPPYSVPATGLEEIVSYFIEGFMAHYAGDEQLTPEIMEQVTSVGAINADLGMILGSIRTDLPPSDGQLVIDMRKKLR